MAKCKSFLGTAYTARSNNVACQRAINIYFSVGDTKEEKEIGCFYGTPGKSLLATIGTGPIRGFNIMSGILYVVSGNTLYSVTSALVVTALGTLNTATGPVSMINNGPYRLGSYGQVMVVDGVDGYVWDSSTNLYTANVLNGVNTLGILPMFIAYQDGFGIVNDANSDAFYQSGATTSGVSNFLVWDSLNYASESGEPGKIVAMIDSQREVFLIGDTWTAVWINAGAAGFVFQRLQGVWIERGCLAPYSTTLVGGNICLLGQDKSGGGIIYMQKGYDFERISTHAIEHQIQNYATMTDAVGYAYQQEGNLFYVLSFPTGGETWVYDVTTSQQIGKPCWHQRAYFSNGNFTRDLGNCATYFNGMNIVGDYSNGNLYQLSLDNYLDNGQPIKRVRSFRAVAGDGDTPMRFNELELDCQTGINVPPDINPQAVLRWTDDSQTWSNEVQSSLGQSGQTAWQVRWTRMGQTKKNSGLDRVFEISTTDQVPIVWIGCDMDAEPA